MIPEKLIDSIHYKKGFQLLKLLRNQNHNNIISDQQQQHQKTTLLQLSLLLPDVHVLFTSRFHP